MKTKKLFKTRNLLSVLGIIIFLTASFWLCAKTTPTISGEINNDFLIWILYLTGSFGIAMAGAAFFYSVSPKEKEFELKDLNDDELIVIEGLTFLFFKGNKSGRACCCRVASSQSISLMLSEDNFADGKIPHSPAIYKYKKKLNKLCPVS